MTSLRIVCLFILVINTELILNKNGKSPMINSQVYRIDSTIKSIDMPSGTGAIDPYLSSDGSRLYLSWLAPNKTVRASLDETASQLKWSYLENKVWSEPEAVLTSSYIFTNSDDILSIILDRNGTQYAHWLEKSNSKFYEYGIQHASYPAHLDVWQPLEKKWKTSTIDRAGYDKSVAMIPAGRKITAFWIDGRKYNEKMSEPSRLVTAELTDKVEKQTVLDDDICRCCDRTAVNTNEGPVVFYRGRTKDEIRDILVVRSAENGWSFLSPVGNDHWRIADCAVNGSKADAVGKQVVLIWYTGITGKGEVRVTFSTDAGKSFTKARNIDDISQDGSLAKVDIELLDKGQVLISWIGRSAENDKEVIYVRKVDINGTSGPYVHIAEVKNSSRVGVPQMERVNNMVYLVWTEPNTINSFENEHEKVKGLKMVQLDLKDIPSAELE